MAAAPAYANITFNATYGGTIAADPNFATIQQTINTALGVFTARITTNITVAIKFDEMGSGLGSSSTFIANRTYSELHNALLANAASLDDTASLSLLPNGSINPVDGSSTVTITTANLRALGIIINPPAGQPDSTIGLNISIINLDRTSIDPNKYDLLAVVSHEVDEALGLGSGLNGTAVRPEDLFRYDQNGLRSYTASSAAQSYFSLDGTTRLAQFNQNGSGDYGDWASSATPLVQDAFGTSGSTPNMGVEFRALDVIGYSLAPDTVPEPATWSMLGLGFSALFAARRARRA